MTVRHSNSYAVTPVWIPKIAHTTDGAIEVVGVTELLVACGTRTLAGLKRGRRRIQLGYWVEGLADRLL